jgi:hypothetical protein
MDMGVHREGGLPARKKNNTGGGLGTDPLDGKKPAHSLRYRHGADAQQVLSTPFKNVPEKVVDSTPLGWSEPRRGDNPCQLLNRDVQNILPAIKAAAKGLVSFVAVAIVGVLGKNGTDELVQGREFPGRLWDAEPFSEPGGDHLSPRRT